MADISISELLEETRMNMEMSIEHFKKELTKVRAGRATPDMVDSVRVDYYGSIVPISQVGNISAPDARTITITPWEKNMIPIIEKAIRDANLGFNPGSDGDMVRVPIPALTGDRRKQLVKQANDVAENSRISIRNARRDANSTLKKMQKDGEPEDAVKTAEKKVQDITNEFGKKIDAILKEKETQITTV
ncbi:MAG: ribosome recycling factor [Bacteroidota bacterium]